MASPNTCFTAIDLDTGDGTKNVLFTGVLNATATINPSDDLDAVGTTYPVTVTGAALGDFVMVAAPYDLTDITVTAYVQAANTVEIRIQNESGATSLLGSGLWKIKVLKG